MTNQIKYIMDKYFIKILRMQYMNTSEKNNLLDEIKNEFPEDTWNHHYKLWFDELKSKR